MTLTVLTPDELCAVYHTHLREAFPPEELKPLWSMERLRQERLYDPLCLRDETGEDLGYVLLWRHVDGRYFLIDYLCVPAARRNGGIGGKLLKAMLARYGEDAVFIGESEAPTGDAGADRLILRRLGFYARNGAATLSYDTALFGVHFKTICWTRGTLPPEADILRAHQEIYLQRFGRKNYDRFIQIPLHPGEAIFPVTEWTEEDPFHPPAP